jgi:hypothetical protein
VVAIVFLDFPRRREPVSPDRGRAKPPGALLGFLRLTAANTAGIVRQTAEIVRGNTVATCATPRPEAKTCAVDMSGGGQTVAARPL